MKDSEVIRNRDVREGELFAEWFIDDYLCSDVLAHTELALLTAGS